MPKFKPQLVETADLAKVTFPKLGQPKHDGIRCVVTPDQGPLLRTLKAIPNDYIRKELSAPEYRWHDGEIVTYTNGQPDELNTVQSKVMSAEGEPQFFFHTFDHFERPDLPFEGRHGRICAGCRVDYTYLNSMDDLLRYVAMNEEGGLTAKGLDGTIIRDPKAPYKFGRVTVNEGYCLRIKPFQSSEARVKGCTEMMRNTNEQTLDERGYAKRSSAKAGMVPAGVLGTLVLKWENGIEFEIGTGFTAAQRAELWADRDELPGRLVSFNYQRVGPNGRPLLPSFTCFRREFEDIV